MPMLDRDSPKPLYVQLEQILRTAIRNKEWEVNHAIPSEIELSKMYSVSRMTARAVITQLVNEGLLYRVQGKGTFVAEPKIPARSLAYMGVRAQLERMGYQTSTRLTHFEIIKANLYLADTLKRTPEEDIIFIERVRSVKDSPISIHRSYLPKALCPTLNEEYLESEQLCVIIEAQFGLKATLVTESLESVLATEEEAALLEIDRRFPLLMLEDLNKTEAGEIFEYSKVLFRGDKVKLHFEYDTR